LPQPSGDDRQRGDRGQRAADGLSAAERPPGRGERARHRETADADRDGLSTLQPVPAQDGPRQRHRSADPRARRAGRAGGEGGGSPARARRARVEAERVPGEAVRRPAATRCDRACAGHAARADAVRRADQRTRSRGDGRGARGDGGTRRRRHDDDRRHARDGIREGRGRPLGDDGRRPDNRGRPSGALLPRAAPGANEAVPLEDPVSMRVIDLTDRRSGLEAFVVIDHELFRFAAGGTRMLPDVRVQEIARLARAMTLKFAALRVPYAGAKAGVRFAGGDRAAVLAAYKRALEPYRDVFAPGPDMGTFPADFLDDARWPVPLWARTHDGLGMDDL